MTLRTATLKGQPPRNFKRIKKDSTGAMQDRKESVSLVSSARTNGIFIRPSLIPDNIEKQNQLGEDLIDWVESKEATSIDNFFVEKKMSPSAFYRTAETNSYLAQCLDIALAKISTRLSELLKNNQLYIMNSIKHYSSMAREEARLKRESEKEAKVITTYVEEKIGIPVFTKKKK